MGVPELAIIIVPDDYATIALAVAAAVAGDEIQVKGGPYDESVLIDTRDHITLTGVDTGAGYPVVGPTTNTHPAYDCAAIILRKSNFITVNNLVLNNTAVAPEKNYGVVIRSSSDIVIQAIEATILKSAVVLQVEGTDTCKRLVFNNNNFHDIIFTDLTEGFGIDDQGASQDEITITNNIFNVMQYGIGLNPLNAADIVGKYVVTDNTFSTIDHTGLAVESDEGMLTNSATILAYRNIFIANLVDNMRFSENSVHSVLNTPSPQVYCWKTVARLGTVGNYYSTHVGVDANDDGIFDEPEIISANHIDNAPLFHAWGAEYTACQRVRGYVYNAGATASDNVPVPMAGVTVTITDPVSGASQSAVTNVAGYYFFALPPIGENMLISVNVNGFVITDIPKTIGLVSNLPVDFYLWNVHKYGM